MQPATHHAQDLHNWILFD